MVFNMNIQNNLKYLSDINFCFYEKNCYKNLDKIDALIQHSSKITAPDFEGPFYSKFNIDNIESFTLNTFRELAQEKESIGFPFVIAFVESVTSDNEILYKPYCPEKLDDYRAQLSIYTQFNDPSSRNLIKRIHYYVLINLQDENFIYFSTETVGVNNIQKELIYYLLTAQKNQKFEALTQVATLFDPTNVREINAKSGIVLESNVKLAFELYKKIAHKDMCDAQLYLGMCYHEGKGTDINFEKAFDCFNVGAKNGCAASKCMLGVCYCDGIGVFKDRKKGIEWFEQAAEYNIPIAQYSLYLQYSLDDNTELAIKWLKKAAENGVFEAQCELFYCYFMGNRIEVDDEKAFEWLKKARAQDNDKTEDFLKAKLSLLKK